MKKITLSIFLIYFSVFSQAQFEDQQIISTTTDRPYLSMPIDLDNDGFTDVLTASYETFLLKWHKNLDGQGNFGPEIILNSIPEFYLSIYYVDVDSDGDKDLLLQANNPKTISWLENIDDSGTFSDERIIIDNQPEFIISSSPEDIDNDGDIDLLVKFTDTFNDRLVWYENLDGTGNFSNENLILENYNRLSTPLFVDIDGDGLKDILTAHENNGPANLVWFKNLGNEAFGSQQLIFGFDFRLSDLTSIGKIDYVDVNSDSLKDIVITTVNDDSSEGVFVDWLEHTDGQGNFGPPQDIPNTIAFKYCFYDFDNDDDLDILFLKRNEDAIQWIENEDGLGTFSTIRTITTEIDFPSDAQAADIDGDGFLDVLSASGGDDKVAWYRNSGTLGVVDINKRNLKIYPNPTTGKLFFEGKTALQTIDIITILGQKVMTVSNSDEIDISYLASGIYVIKVTQKDSTSSMFRVIRK